MEKRNVSRFALPGNLALNRPGKKLWCKAKLGVQRKLAGKKLPPKLSGSVSIAPALPNRSLFDVKFPPSSPTRPATAWWESFGGTLCRKEPIWESWGNSGAMKYWLNQKFLGELFSNCAVCTELGTLSAHGNGVYCGTDSAFRPACTRTAALRRLSHILLGEECII